MDSWYYNGMTEADKTSRLIKYLKNRWQETCAIECKIAKGNRIAFNEVKPHQEMALYVAKHGTLPYKIGDLGWDQKPFDLFVLYMVPAYVCIFWYRTRGEKTATMIPIDLWLNEKATSGEKSLSYDRSLEIGRVIEI